MLSRIWLGFFLIFPLLLAQADLVASSENNKIEAVDSLTLLNKSHIHPQRLVLATTGIGLANWAIYQPFKEIWWQEKRTGFHFYRGYRRTIGYWDFGWHDSYCGHVDKLGHFYCSKLMAQVLTDLSHWVGFSKGSSLWIGSLSSFLLMLEIEIYDSFFEEWGFSLGDLTANALGALAPIARQKITFLNRFQFKFSYRTSPYYQSEDSFIKDYSGMTFWLSYNINQDLPERIAHYLPDFLNVSVGYGIDRPAHGNVELFIAPDINWSKIYHGKNSSLKYILKILDQFHFPCMTWQIKPQSKFHWIYF